MYILLEIRCFIPNSYYCCLNDSFNKDIIPYVAFRSGVTTLPNTELLSDLSSDSEICDDTDAMINTISETDQSHTESNTSVPEVRNKNMQYFVHQHFHVIYLLNIVLLARNLEFGGLNPD